MKALVTDTLRKFSAVVARPFVRFATTAVAASILVIGGVSQTQTVIANGDTRTLSFVHRHTGEELTVTFKRNGHYDTAALAALNRLLRDWRNDEQTRMDPVLFDIIWEVHRTVRATAPIHVFSAYRSPGTNAMLRRRSRAVAQHSQHINGRALDFFIPGAEMRLVREAGLQLQRGGVGFYPGSANRFVHMDTGSVRHWPKVSRDTLARLFPDGRTVHIPADGRPMPGFDQALAMVQARGGTASRFYDSRRDEQVAYVDDEDRGGVVRQRGGGMGLFAGLFGNQQPQAQAPVIVQRATSRVRGQPQPVEAPVPTTVVAARQPEPASTARGATAVIAAAQPAAVAAQPARVGPPLQITPQTPARTLLAQAPLPVRAPPASVRMRGADDDDDEEETTPVRLASAPLPVARPVTEPRPFEAPPALVAMAAASDAARPAQNRPTPLPEPTVAERVVAASAPVLSPPMPTARPQTIGGSTQVAGLPPLITTGDQRGRPVEASVAPAFALAFASPSQPVTLPPSAAQTPQPRAAAPQPPARIAQAPRPASRPAPPLVAPSVEPNRGGRMVFHRQGTERAQGTLSTPDHRQLRLIEAPDQVVAQTFSRAPQGAIVPGRFAGEAIATLRTIVVTRADQPTPQRRASLQ